MAKKADEGETDKSKKHQQSPSSRVGGFFNLVLSKRWVRQEVPLLHRSVLLKQKLFNPFFPAEVAMNKVCAEWIKVSVVNLHPEWIKVT